VHLAIDLHVDLVEVPPPWGVGPHAVDAFFPDLGREDWPEAVPPKPDGFVTDIDSALTTIGSRSAICLVSCSSSTAVTALRLT
jgi:hypothetical protein